MNSLLIAAILLIQAPNGTVSGRLLSAPGVPAIGVRITAKSVADSAAPTSPEVLVSIVQTDSAGRYRLENVPPGRYFITAGLVDVPTYYPGTSVLGDARAIDITAGATANVPDFIIQQASIRPATATARGRAIAFPPPVDPRLRLLPKLADPVSVDVVQDARASYEALGQIAGVRVLFDRRFVPGVPAPFKAQGIDALAALNLLSSQTGNTWTILGRDTIIVVPATFGIANLDLQLPSRDLAEAASVYPGSKPQPTGQLSFEIKATSTAAFEAIANMVGMTVILDPGFPGRPIQLKLENADIYSALDILSMQGGAFWAPYDSKTILVSSDTASSHYDFDLRIVKMFHLSKLKSAQEIIDAAAAVRKALSPQNLLPIPTANAILVVDTPKTIALAEKLIAELDKTPVLQTESEAIDGAGNIFVLEPAGPRNVTPYHTELQPRAGLYSLDSTLPTRQAYEKFAESAGVSVVFDPNLRTFAPGQLQKLDNVDFFKGLDLVSLQTRTFWVPLNSKTIFVASNNGPNRRDYDPQILKTFYLNVATPQEVDGIRDMVRVATNTPNIVENTRAKAIIIRDTPLNLALAEMLIMQLTRSNMAQTAGTPPVRSSIAVETYSVSNTFIRDFSSRATKTPVRSQLQPDIVAPISMQMNENARATYEALTRAAGLQVAFDSRFVPSGPVAFHVDNANIFDALSILSYQTKTFWRVVDSKTILVAPATNAIRNELEPKIQKSIPLTNVQTQQDINVIVNTVRQILLISNGIAPNAAMNAIEITETAEKVGVAEALIRSLDVP